MAGRMGIDFSAYDLDAPITYVKNDAVQSATEALTSADPDRVWTVREIAEFGGIGGLGPVIVGSPQRVADELQAWVEETDIDGFNLAYAVSPETFSDIVDLLVRSCSAAVSISASTHQAPFGKSCSAVALIWRRRIRPPATDTG